MGEIYRRANHVAIWLGETPKSVVTLHDVREFARSYISLGRTRGDKLHPGVRAASAWTAARLRSAALREVVTRDGPQWISRVWVRQEFLLATSSTLYFGSNIVRVSQDREAIHHVDTYLQDLWDYGAVLGKGHTDAGAFWRTLYQIDGIRRQLPTRLSEADALLRATESNDPRDRIYALLSIIRPKESSMIKIDYARSCGWVYAEATRASLIEGNSLDLLREAITLEPSSVTALPSRAVDFSDTNIYYRENEETTGRIASESSLRWPADASARESWQERLKARSEGWNVLRLTGVAIGTVIDTTTSFRTKEPYASVEQWADCTVQGVSFNLCRLT